MKIEPVASASANLYPRPPLRPVGRSGESKSFPAPYRKRPGDSLKGHLVDKFI